MSFSGLYRLNHFKPNLSDVNVRDTLKLQKSYVQMKLKLRVYIGPNGLKLKAVGFLYRWLCLFVALDLSFCAAKILDMAEAPTICLKSKSS